MKRLYLYTNCLRSCIQISKSRLPKTFDSCVYTALFWQQVCCRSALKPKNSEGINEYSMKTTFSYRLNSTMLMIILQYYRRSFYFKTLVKPLYFVQHGFYFFNLF